VTFISADDPIEIIRKILVLMPNSHWIRTFLFWLGRVLDIDRYNI
jgi:hypothetical protein